jgi:hypothetical protein
MPCDRLALPLLLSVAVTTTAANSAHAESAAAAQAAPVSTELLEFLGGFETSGGKAIDPLLFLDNGRQTKAADPNTAPAAKTPSAATLPENKP